jgi:hypothetical protein
MLKHLREELEDAKKAPDWRVEARLVARNSIIAGAVAVVPLGVLMGVIALILWDASGAIPGLMSNAAMLYPMTVIFGVAGAILCLNRGAFTLAMLLALAPFLCVPAFLVGLVMWLFG